MATDQSVPPAPDSNPTLLAQRAEMQAAIKEMHAEVARLRKAKPWGAIAGGGLIGGNGSFPSYVQFMKGCEDLHRCNLVVADRIERQAIELKRHLDEADRSNTDHGDRLRRLVS